MKKPFVVFVVGATATGKSLFALECARKFGGEIINADSIQMYQSVDIGSAKPTPAERLAVPHHLIDFIPEGESYTAGQFRRDALRILNEASQRKVPIVYVVGGSGFYIQALLKGLFEIPDVPQEIKDAVRKESPDDLYIELQEKDPDYAQKIKPQDSYRICRAVEVIRGTGQTLTSFRDRFKAEEFPYPYIKVGLRLPKIQLVANIKLRTEVMLQRGWLEETEALVKKGLYNWPALKSVGYKECVQYIRGEIKKEVLADAIVQSTVQLAKRQSTWFKKDPDIQWFANLELDNAFQQVKQCIQ